MRSFVRREGRLTPAQRRALSSLSERYGPPPGTGVLDLDALFGRRAPRIVEIGCGRGDVLLTLAERHPGNDYLAVEVYRPGVGRLLNALDARDLANVRVLTEDAAQVFGHRLPPRSLDAVYVFFPDPWPKKRHHKRRLIDPGFLGLVRRALALHGRAFIATDWDDYAAHILEAVAATPGLSSVGVGGGPAPRPRWRPVTAFERRALEAGRAVHDFCLARDPTAATAPV